MSGAEHRRLAFRRAACALLIVLASSFAAAQSSSPEAAFYLGNQLFEKKDVKGAIAAYQEALAAGAGGTVLEFNLGTAYLWDGQIGRAIFHLRRAHALAPRDEDVKTNLTAARARAAEKFSRPASPAFVSALLWAHRELSLREAFWLFAALYALAMSLYLARAFVERRLLSRLAIVPLALALALAASLAMRLRPPEVKDGVIIDPEVLVFTGPSDTAYSVNFKLHQGAEVDVLEETDGWIKIAAPTGPRGYVPASQIGVL
jgi:tetratricopeptide (TPR) repeat protein